MSELADALRVDPSTATRAVQRLLRMGLAERGPHHDDGRVVMVSATPTGRTRYDAILRFRRSFMAEVLSGFDPNERRLFADLLERLLAAVDDAAGLASRPSP
jgi:DNA-binding MarR family transcriptional regulator